MSASLTDGVVGSAFAAVNPPMSERAGQPVVDPSNESPPDPPVGSAFAEINPPVNPAKALGISIDAESGKGVSQ